MVFWSQLYKKTIRSMKKDGIIKTSRDIKNYILWNKIWSKKRKFWYNTQMNTIKNKLNYNRVANPWAPIWIEIEDIEHSPETNITSVSSGRILYGFGQIIGGDWDLYKDDIKDNITYRGLKQRFVKGHNWRETEYVQWHENKIQCQGESYGFDNIDDFVDIRCEYLDNMYYEFKNNGYTLNNKRIVGDNTCGRDTLKKNWNHSYEPFILIGRSGEFLVGGDGSHRRAIAEFAGLQKLPHNVLIRHKKWQETRESIAKNGLSKTKKRDVASHPDMNDII